VAHVERWMGFWSWRNPFVKLIVLMVLSALGGISLATVILPFWVHLVIYAVWLVTAGLLLICGTAVVLEEGSRRKKRNSSDDKR
jgi:hypothetical protein